MAKTSKYLKVSECILASCRLSSILRLSSTETSSEDGGHHVGCCLLLELHNVVGLLLELIGVKKAGRVRREDDESRVIWFDLATTYGVYAL